jgi:hypothetical protein
MLSSCPPAVDAPRTLVRLSVHDHSLDEAQRYKWIASEQAGRDLGAGAIRQWVREHWNGYLRERWIEHLEGRKFWIELDHDDYGLLERAFQGSALIGEILRRLKSGQENLDVLCWAIDEHLPMDEVLEILETLDINSRRVECLVESRLAQAQAG